MMKSKTTCGWWCWLFFLPVIGLADDGATGTATGFRPLLEKHSRQTFDAVAKYVTEHPQADDAEQAFPWLFETATAHGWEADSLKLAETYLQRMGSPAATRLAAQQVFAVGCVRANRVSEGVAAFESHLASARFQINFRTLEFAHAVSAEARLAGDLPAARSVYQRLSTLPLINPAISDIAEGRLGRLELFGQPAPQPSVADLDGKSVNWDDYRGKVLVLDFWGTNCPPCLAEFPEMKRLYRDFHDRGLEVLGISFDETPGIVEHFLSRPEQKLPWRIAMNETPNGKASQRFRVQTIPALFVVDREGKVAQVDVYGRNLRRTIERLLEK
jgi:peroxiredoxin